MTAAIAERQETTVTPEQLLAMDDAIYELVDGRLVEKNASVKSSATGTRIIAVLSPQAVPEFDVYPSRQGYQCFPDDPKRIRKPNVSLIRASRWDGLPDTDPDFIPFPPDLAVEVVSKNDTSSETSAKVREYLDAGFPRVWVLDPYFRTLATFSASGEMTIRGEHDEVTLPDLLPEFRCRVGDLLPPA